MPEHHHAAVDGAAPPPQPGAGNGAVAPDAVLDPKRDPYAALVRAPDDLIAALAYVTYKHHEMEFIRAISGAAGRFVGVLHGEAAHGQPQAAGAPGGAAVRQGSKQESRSSR